MTTSRRTAGTITAWALLLLLATGCASNGTPPSAGTSTSPSSAAAVAAPSPSAVLAASPSPTGPDCQTLSGLSGPLFDHGTRSFTGSTVHLHVGSVEGGGFYFDPSCAIVRPGRTITVVLVNTDTNSHNLTVESQHIAKDVLPGKSITVTVEIPKSGAVPFYCRFHADFGQQGAFVAGP